MSVDYSGAYAAPRMDLGEALMETRVNGAGGYVATRILPIFGTPKKKASFSAITREAILADNDAKREKRGSYNRVSMGATDLDYECEEYGLEMPKDDVERELYRSDFDYDMACAMIAENQLRIQQEKRVAALIQDPVTNWPSGDATRYTDVATDWDNIAATIIADVRAAKEKVRALTGMTPDTLVLSKAQYNHLFANTQILARFPGATAFTEETIQSALAAILGLREILVGNAVRNSAIEGQAAVVADIWNDDYALVCLPNRGGLVEGGLGRTFLWTPDSPDEVTVDEYREEQSRSMIIRVRQHVDEKLFDASFGHLLKIDT